MSWGRIEKDWFAMTCRLRPEAAVDAVPSVDDPTPDEMAVIAAVPPDQTADGAMADARPGP